MTTLQRKAKSMRGRMKSQTEKTVFPERFEVTVVDDKRHVIVKDTKTGKTTEVSTFAYRSVKKALFDLFNE